MPQTFFLKLLRSLSGFHGEVATATDGVAIELARRPRVVEARRLLIGRTTVDWAARSSLLLRSSVGGSAGWLGPSIGKRASSLSSLILRRWSQDNPGRSWWGQ